MNGRGDDGDSGTGRRPDYLHRDAWVEARQRINERIQRAEDDIRELEQAQDKLAKSHAELYLLIRVRAGQVAIGLAAALFLVNLFGSRLLAWLWPS